VEKTAIATARSDRCLTPPLDGRKALAPMRLVWVVAGALLWMLNPSSATSQAAYAPVLGSPDVLLNPAHEDTVGSEFTQQCTGLPRPIQAVRSPGISSSPKRARA
jgi:hypothetical protein